LEILQAEDTSRMPFLWSTTELRQSVSEGIRTVARGVQHEMQEMYDTVATTLIAENPHLFGKKEGTSDDEWMFSYQQFQWAFAMVNTRHWQLPIQDLEHQNNNNVGVFVEDNVQPPASTPTDEWALQRQQASQEDETDEKDGAASKQRGGSDPPSRMRTQQSSSSSNSNNGSASDGTAKSSTSNGHSLVTQRHSFLAPVADLLNFGPPCTRGHYNRQLHSFEIIASCDLKKGQEVTFWYSDECDHVMVGVYGFMHPIVPPCPSAEEYRQSAEEYRDRAQSLRHKLDRAVQNLQVLEDTVEHYRDVLSDCDCCEYDDEFIPDSLFYNDYDNDDEDGEEHDHYQERRPRDEDEQDASHDDQQGPGGHNVRGGRNQASSHRKEDNDDETSHPNGRRDNHVEAQHGNTHSQRRARWGRGTKSRGNHANSGRRMYREPDDL